MTSERHLFVDYQEMVKPREINVGDGHGLSAIGVGTVRIALKISRSITRYALLKNVLHVPEISKSLISVRAATDNGLMVVFGKTRCWLKDCKGQVRGMGTRGPDKLYHLDQNYTK